MKIEIVSFTGNSGLADYAVSLARALTHHVQTRIVSGHSLPRRFDNLGFKVERTFHRSRRYPIDIFRFLFNTLRRQPDWLILQGPLKFPIFDALIIRLIRLFSIKAAITVHDVLPHYPRRWSVAEFSFYYRSFDKVIAHSDTARQILIQTLGITKDILVVPHGIYDIFDLTNIKQTDARQKIGGLEVDDFVIIFFGHLEPRKGLMEFLAVAKASNQPKVKFLIAGSNDLSKHGQKYVDELEAARLLPNLIIHDKRIEFEDVENYFSACDVVALPYLEGTTSGVLKLALAFGKPVVATRVGDLSEQIPKGGGIFLDCKDDIVANLPKAIRRLKDHYPSYSKVMADTKQTANWSTITEKILAHLSTENNPD